jgi:hypothetical protein
LNGAFFLWFASFAPAQLTGLVSLDDSVDASSCAPAAAGFMMLVAGLDREVLVDAGDVLCKLLLATEQWIDWESVVFGEKKVKTID